MKNESTIETTIDAVDGDKSQPRPLTLEEIESLRAETRAGIDWMRQVIRGRTKHPENS